MWGAIASAAAGLAGSVISGIQSSNSRKKYMAVLDKSEKDSISRYNRNHYGKSVAAQNAINNYKESAKDSMSKAEGTDAVMGTENADKQREANSRGMADINARGAEIEQSMQQHAEDVRAQESAQIAQQRGAAYVNQANQSAQAGSQMLASGVNAAQALGSGTGARMSNNGVGGSSFPTMQQVGGAISAMSNQYGNDSGFPSIEEMEKKRKSSGMFGLT